MSAVPKPEPQRAYLGVSNIEVIYDHVILVLKGVSLSVHEGKVVALRYADHGYILENGRVVMDGAAAELAANEDVKEFYLGISSGARRSFKDVKHYRRRKRWLA